MRTEHEKQIHKGIQQVVAKEVEKYNMQKEGNWTATPSREQVDIAKVVKLKE